MFSPLQKDTTRLELNFTMHSYSSAPRPCLWNYYLEIRDGNSQSANVLGVFFVFKVNGQAPVRAVQCLPIYRPLSNPWLKVQCLRVGSTINRGPPDTNFVGESNPTSQTLNTLTPKIEHARSQHKQNGNNNYYLQYYLHYLLNYISGP